MRAISLLQPWATLVALGAKRRETRSWPTRYRGPIAIHASKGMPRASEEACSLPLIKEVLVKAGYATELRNVAIAFAMSGIPDEQGNLSWTMEVEDDVPVITYRAGRPREGRPGFVYSLSPEGFQEVADHQWVSFSPVTPISCETIQVDDYLGWVRLQTT